jgi:hypothetical protein
MAVPEAVSLLSPRPGEFLRRTDELLRVACASGPDAAVDDVLNALAAAASQASPAALLSAYAQLRGRAVSLRKLPGLSRSPEDCAIRRVARGYGCGDGRRRTSLPPNVVRCARAAA